MQEKEQYFSPIKQRILHFASNLGISKRDFYSKIGVSRGTLESKTGITEDVITKFFATYPEVNIEWLMTGRGEMLADGGASAPAQPQEPPPTAAAPTALTPKDLIDTIREQATEIGRLQERIAQLERENARLASDARTSAIADAG